MQSWSEYRDTYGAHAEGEALATERGGNNKPKMVNPPGLKKDHHGTPQHRRRSGSYD